MLLPVLLRDARMRQAKPKGEILKMWGGAMFLTNVFLLPLMGMRAARDPEAFEEGKTIQAVGDTSILDRLFGITGLVVGSYSLYYAFFGGDFGTAADRIAFFQSQLESNRITIAFSVDVLLFAYFQHKLLSENKKERVPRTVASVPLFGMSLWLLL